MNAASLVARVNAAITKVGGMSKPLYLRTVVQSTGDALIGRDTGIATDDLIDPQPVYRQLGKRDLIYLNSLGHQVTADDYKVTFAPSSITEEQLRDPTAQLVIKDPAVAAQGFNVNPDEVLRILYVNSESYQAATVLVTVIARSVSNNV